MRYAQSVGEEPVFDAFGLRAKSLAAVPHTIAESNAAGRSTYFDIPARQPSVSRNGHARLEYQRSH
jgi:hypothetical protein